MRYILFFLSINFALVSCKTSSCSMTQDSLENVFECCGKRQDLFLTLAPSDTIFETFPEEIFSCYSNPRTIGLDLYSIKAPVELYKANKASKILLNFHLKENNKIFNQESLVKQVQTFKNIEVMYLTSFFMLKELFKNPLDFPKLKELYLSNNILEKGEVSTAQQFPRNLDKISKLKILEFSNLSVDSINLTESNFQRLLTLSVTNLDIQRDLYLDGFNAPLLEKITLQKVKIESSALAEIFSNNSNTLKKLEARDVDLTTFPTNFTKCKKLQLLILEKLRLDSLPKDIVSLKKLKTLIYRDMQLGKLPEGFSLFKRMQEIEFSNNNLHEFPLELTKLKNLRYLNLSNNPITAIPKDIVNLKNLKILSLYGVKLSDSNKLELKKWLPNTEIQF